MTLPVLQFDNDIFVPIENAGEYTINVNLYNSSVSETCDHFSLSDSGSTTILSSPQFDGDSGIFIYPNPSNGVVYFNNPDSIVAIDVYDNLGRLIRKYSNPINNIQLNGILSGVYYLNFKTAVGSDVRKLVVR